MPTLEQQDADRARAHLTELAKQYRAIGSAAIVAALICKPKTKKSDSAFPKAA